MTEVDVFQHALVTQHHNKSPAPMLFAVIAVSISIWSSIQIKQNACVQTNAIRQVRRVANPAIIPVLAAKDQTATTVLRVILCQRWALIAIS
jgi:hypothetical protein